MEEVQMKKTKPAGKLSVEIDRLVSVNHQNIKNAQILREILMRFGGNFPISENGNGEIGEGEDSLSILSREISNGTDVADLTAELIQRLEELV